MKTRLRKAIAPGSVAACKRRQNDQGGDCGSTEYNAQCAIIDMVSLRWRSNKCALSPTSSPTSGCNRGTCSHVTSCTRPKSCRLMGEKRASLRERDIISLTHQLTSHHCWKDAKPVAGFLAQHSKITLLVEKSMRLVDATVTTMPYWDATIEMVQVKTGEIESIWYSGKYTYILCLKHTSLSCLRCIHAY